MDESLATLSGDKVILSKEELILKGFKDIGLKKSTVLYKPDFLSPSNATELKDKILKSINLEKKPLEGRLTALYGNSERYDYAKNQGKPLPFTPELEQVIKDVESLTGYIYNVSLINYYKNGKEQFRFHADTEELGNKVPIVSITLMEEGVARPFDFIEQKNLDEKEERSKSEFLRMDLEHGSILLMYSETHEHYLHRLPNSKTKKDRLNITLRHVDVSKYENK